MSAGLQALLSQRAEDPRGNLATKVLLPGVPGQPACGARGSNTCPAVLLSLRTCATAASSACPRWWDPRIRRGQSLGDHAGTCTLPTSSALGHWQKRRLRQSAAAWGTVGTLKHTWLRCPRWMTPRPAVALNLAQLVARLQQHSAGVSAGCSYVPGAGLTRLGLCRAAA